MRVERPDGAGGTQTLETILKRNLHPIRIQAEDRHAGRKFITKISGLEDFCIDPTDFSHTLQRAFSTSAAVQKLPGKQETGMEINIQGNVLKAGLPLLGAVVTQRSSLSLYLSLLSLHILQQS